jgi:peptidoglycan/LPS O-acetylase OafA/YrhL
VRPARLHLDYLDGVRACAALYVLLDHIQEYSGIEDHAHGMLAAVLNALLKRGHYAVDVFITLSGFCLMMPVVRGGVTLRGGAIEFFKRRARRILPPYYAALGVSLLLAMFVIRNGIVGAYDDCLPVDRFAIATHLLLVQDLFHQTMWKINNVMWTISVEWRIYFALPLLVLLWRRFGAIATTTAAVALSFVLLAALKHTPIDTETWGCNPQYLGLFAIGCLGSGITFSGSTLLTTMHSKTPWLAISGISMAVVIALQKPTSGGWTGALLDLVVGLAAAALLIGIRDKDHPGNRLFSCRPLASVGIFSYSLYLIHAPLLEIIYLAGLRHFTDRPLEAFGLYVALVPAILGACYLFFLAFEKPFRSGSSKQQAVLKVKAVALP